MQLFKIEIQNNIASIIDSAEIHHCVKVCRYRIGDKLLVSEFKGKIWNAFISKIEDKFVNVELESIFSQEVTSSKIHIAISLTQQSDRFEWFLEKTTETAISKISPIICSRTENKKEKRDRWEKIIYASSKQCLRSSLPELDDLISLKEFFKTRLPDQRYICHCEDSALPYFGKLYNPQREVLILIGPEGDFGKEEIQMAKSLGFIEASLGKERLRVETAGVAACIIAKTMKYLV